MAESVQSAFNASLEQFVSKYGLARSTSILKSFVQTRARERWNTRRRQLVFDFIAEEATQVFGLQPTELLTGTNMDCRDARMCCYVLVKGYTDFTYKQLGTYFQRDKQHLIYYTRKLREILTIPDYYRDLVARYVELEERFAHFLTKLN